MASGVALACDVAVVGDVGVAGDVSAVSAWWTLDTAFSSQPCNHSKILLK